jgi:hypothetical protein
VAGLAHRGLVDEHARVRQGEALAGRAGRAMHGRGRGGLPSTTVWICGRMYCIVS